MGNEIQAYELESYIEQGATIIDIRQRDFFQMGTAEGAVNIPYNPNTGSFGVPGEMGAEEAQAAIDALPKDRPVILMCYRGMMSLMASRVMEAQGFDAYSLAGGYPAYVENF